MISVRVLLEKQIQININTVNYLDFKKLSFSWDPYLDIQRPPLNLVI